MDVEMNPGLVKLISQSRSKPTRTWNLPVSASNFKYSLRPLQTNLMTAPSFTEPAAELSNPSKIIYSLLP
jgi:hypothetical protein